MFFNLRTTLAFFSSNVTFRACTVVNCKQTLPNHPSATVFFLRCKRTFFFQRFFPMHRTFAHVFLFLLCKTFVHATAMTDVVAWLAFVKIQKNIFTRFYSWNSYQNGISTNYRASQRGHCNRRSLQGMKNASICESSHSFCYFCNCWTTFVRTASPAIPAILRLRATIRLAASERRKTKWIKG